MRKLIFFIFLFLSSLRLLSQNDELYSLMKERNEFYFSFEVDDFANLNEISKIVSIDKINGNVITAYSDYNQYLGFVELGHEMKLQTPPSMKNDFEMFDGKTRAEYEWNEYPTYEAYVAMMQEFAEEYPDKCSLMELCVLESGRKILIIRLNNGGVICKPKVLLASTIHGDETIGYVMMLRLINEMLTNEINPAVNNIMQNVDLFICPNANPDGTYHDGNHTVKGATRSNAFGVDMNRNYPDSENGAHSDGKDYALETECFMQLAEDFDFTLAAHFHGGAEVVNYPWDNTYSRHVDDEWWKMISRQYVDMVHEMNPNYMIDRDNGITNGSDWYRIYGGRQDYMNYYHQCREVTIECSAVKCPPASELSSYWEYNYNSIFSFVNQVLFGIHGVVTDFETGLPLESTIRILNHDMDYSMVKSRLSDGSFYRPIKSGKYLVEILCDGYKAEYQEITIEDNEKKYLDIKLHKNNESCFDIDCENKLIEMVNITDDVITVKCEYFLGNIEWNLLNIQSQIVKKSYETLKEFNINVSDLDAGFYLLKVSSDGKQEVKKIVVR